MKCFVASAFGHEDVDRVYKKGIEAALKTALPESIKALRVDKVEHNEDIDDKIIALMKSADFCITDLTYARPSAYFEAGYILGSGKQVIFTCRDDHFRQKDDDHHGNFSIHFDLKMKNVIGWRSPDAVFVRRLQKRIRHVATPLERRQSISPAEDAERKSFQNAAITDQLKLLQRKAQSAIARARFAREVDEDHPYFFEWLWKKPTRQKSAPRLVVLQGANRCDAANIKSLVYRIDKLRHSKEWRGKLRVEVILYTLADVKLASLRTRLREYQLDEKGCLKVKVSSSRSVGPLDKPAYRLGVSIHLISGVQSVRDFQQRFEQTLENLE